MTSLYLNQCNFISHVFERFCFIPKFTNTSVVELSVLRGVAVFFFNARKSVHLPIAVLPLLKVPHVSASASEDMTLLIVLHYVWIGPFILGLGFIGFWRWPISQIEMSSITTSCLWHGEIFRV